MKTLALVGSLLIASLLGAAAQQQMRITDFAPGAPVSDTDVLYDVQGFSLGTSVGTSTNVTAAMFKTYCLSGLAPAWSTITSTPTTLGGYGITDAYTKTASDARYPLASALATVATSGSYDDLTHKLTATAPITISGDTISVTIGSAGGVEAWSTQLDNLSGDSGAVNLGGTTLTMPAAITVSGHTITFPSSAATLLAANGSGAGLTALPTNATLYPVLNQSTTGNAGTVTGLSVAGGKALTASNSITISGTDGSTLNVGPGGTLGANAYNSTAFLAGLNASNTAFVDVAGNDSTGTIGRMDKPFLTIGAAVTAANAVATSTSPVVVHAGPGIFTESILACSAYVSLTGSGMNVTIINSSSVLGVGSVNNAAIWTPGSNTFNGWFTINATASGTNVFQCPIGPNATGMGVPNVCTGAVISGISVNGNSDCVYICGNTTPVGMSFYNCQFASHYDTVNLLAGGGEIDFYNCQSTVTGPFYAGSTDPARCIVANGSGTASILRWYGGKLSASGSPTNYGAYGNGSSSYIEIHGATFSISGTSPDDILNSNGSVVGVSGCARADRTVLTYSGTAPVNLDAVQISAPSLNATHNPAPNQTGVVPDINDLLNDSQFIRGLLSRYSVPQPLMGLSVNTTLIGSATCPVSGGLVSPTVTTTSPSSVVGIINNLDTFPLSGIQYKATDFSKNIWWMVRLIGNGSAASTNGVFRYEIGQNKTTTGDLTKLGVGFALKLDTAGVGHFYGECYGSSLTMSGSSKASLDLSGTQVGHIVLINSDGAGNVYFYVDGTLVESLTGGPTTASGNGSAIINVELTNGGDAVANVISLAALSSYVAN